VKSAINKIKKNSRIRFLKKAIHVDSGDNDMMILAFRNASVIVRALLKDSSSFWDEQQLEILIGLGQQT
jgi:hypothetical protein